MSMLDNFIDWYSNINKNKLANSYSPHKPLTILLALSKALRDERWIDYVTEREMLEDLISSYSNTQPNCLQPIWRLQNDSKKYPFWTVTPNTFTPNKSGDIPVNQAKEMMLKAGFSEELFKWLNREKGTTQQLIDYIIEDNFPETLSEDLLTQLGVDEIIPVIVEPEKVTSIQTRIKRDPHFPKKVMQAYDYRCCFCELKMYHFQKPFPMEAAHIKWKAQGGECHETNGLALCPTHHYTFDKGIWTLDLNFEIKLHSQVIFDEKTDRFFLDFVGKNVLKNLLNKSLAPKEEYVAWHRENIFGTKN